MKQADETPQRLDRRDAVEAMILRIFGILESRGSSYQAALALINHSGDLTQLSPTVLSSLPDDQLRTLLARSFVLAGDLHAERTGRKPFQQCDWRVLFWSLVGSRTLREAILRAEEVCDVADGRLGTMQLSVQGNSAHVKFDGARSGDIELDYFVALNGQVLFHEMLGWLIGQPLGATVYLMPDINSAIAGYEHWLPVKEVLEGNCNELRFPAALLDNRVVRTIEDCETEPSRNFLFSSTRCDSPQRIAERAFRAMLVELREHGRLPSLTALSQMLELNPTTLRRRLHSAGTSFRMLRDNSRKQLGLELLSQTTLAVEEVADRLDFCDSDALRVAVHNWVGMSPTDFRRSVKATLAESRSTSVGWRDAAKPLAMAGTHSPRQVL